MLPLSFIIAGFRIREVLITTVNISMFKIMKLAIDSVIKNMFQVLQFYKS